LAADEEGMAELGMKREETAAGVIVKDEASEARKSVGSDVAAAREVAADATPLSPSGLEELVERVAAVVPAGEGPSESASSRAARVKRERGTHRSWSTRHCSPPACPGPARR